MAETKYSITTDIISIVTNSSNFRSKRTLPTTIIISYKIKITTVVLCISLFISLLSEKTYEVLNLLVLLINGCKMLIYSLYILVIKNLDC